MKAHVGRAAHCVYSASGVLPANRFLVHVGRIQLNDNSEHTQNHSVREVIVHPEFSRNSIINDIALLKLATIITMTKFVQPVCMWTMDDNQDLIVGKNGTIVGFGLTEADVVSNQLKQALVRVVDALTCIASNRAVFGTHLTTHMFCGKGQPGVSACNGDSGGGMYFEVGDKWYVRGIVSFTPLRPKTSLCDPAQHTAYTDVAKHFRWIEQYIDQRVLSFDTDILEVDYEEKLRLFNYNTCGIKSFTYVAGTVESTDCMKQYADRRVVLNLENKRICADIASKQDEQNCTTLVSGSPLQEMKLIGGTERYFLRGFELLGTACFARPPTVYSNADAYLDWILYNMRYNEPDSVETKSDTSANSSFEARWATLQQEPGKERLRLFNMSSCGVTKTINVNLGEITVYPWMVIIWGFENITDEEYKISAVGVLIHERYVLTSAHNLLTRNIWRSVVLGLYNLAIQVECGTDTCESYRTDVQDTDIKRIIGHPNYERDPLNNNIALVEMVDAANLTKPFIGLICMPFIEELFNTEPLDLIVTSNEFVILYGKKLKELSPTTCQRQLAQEGFLTSAKNIPFCAVDSNSREQSSFLLAAGSPLQASFRVEERERFFLRGINVRNNLTDELPYLPELFTNIGRFLDWILDNVQSDEDDSSNTNVTGPERINKPPIRNASKKHLFDFNTCGLSANGNADYPIPWMGNLSSNAPFLGKTQCSITLINCNLPIQRIPVRKVIIHPQYSDYSYSNDIALIELANRVDTSLPNVKPICLPILDEIRSYDKASLVSVSENEAATSYMITSLDDRYVASAECQKRWNGMMENYSIEKEKIRKVKSVYLIHNGIDAKEGHWPWHVAIFHQKPGKLEYACGGSILDETTVLTAAHCVYYANAAIAANLVSVQIGLLNLKDSNDYIQKHSVRQVILHPGYGSTSIIHDIALLKLATNITMTKFVQPVCLWTMDSNQELIVGKNGTIVGFGLTEEDVVSNQLKQALVGVVDALSCIASDRQVFGTHLTPDMFCGGGRTSVSACNGDSGGGMYFEVGGKWYVRGIVSFTPLRGNTRLCDPSKYTAFTDAAKYFGWIEQYIDQRVLSFETDVLDVDYEEKLALFNFKTCGVTSSALVGQGNGSWTLPWLGFVTSSATSDNIFNSRCVVTLVSDWYVVGPGHCFASDGVERSILLGGARESNQTQCFDRNGTSVCTYPTQTLQIERIITHPKYDSNDLANNIVLVELLRAADTTKPNVKPICIAVTPELRTNQMTNLSIASYNSLTQSFVSRAVRSSNTVDCMKQYDDLGLSISWKNMRFCAQTTSDDRASCKSLRSGAPLQELRSFSTTERYFLRGFELFGLGCSSQSPPVYNNIDPYLDWILYNMQYNMLEKAENVSSPSNASKQSLDARWAELLQQPGKQNLRLFNRETCGLTTTRNQNLGKTTVYPWVGFLQQAEHVDDEASTTKSLVVLISEWYALAPKRIVDFSAAWRMILLGKYNPKDPTNCYTGDCVITFQFVEIRNIIIPPKNYPRQMLALIELLEPANLKIPSISPICLPFMEQLHTSKPKELVILLNADNFGIASKKLTMVDYLNCQQRLLLANQLVTFDDGDFPCAIEAEKHRQVPLSSTLGVPLQQSVRFGGRTRFFLYGFDANEPDIFADLKYGPYLFGDIQLTDFTWVLENVQPKMYNASSLDSRTKEPTSGLVSLQSLRSASKSRLFNFDTCGINAVTNRPTIQYPMPWIGNVFSNAPFFNVSRCSVTLISDWYAVGPAYCFPDGETSEHSIVFGVGSGSSECADNERSPECGLPLQRIGVAKVTIHPQHNKSDYSNEIALVQLAQRVNTSLPNVKPICLPILDEVRSYDKSSLAMASTSEFNSNLLITAIDNRYIDLDECEKRWQGMAVRFSWDHSMICIITKRSRDDACVVVFTGASLHSVQQLNSRNRHFLRGFSTILTRGCSLYYPIIYLDTDVYLDWIVENMDEKLHSSDSSFDLREKLVFT
uniref:Peptidase S1 domain-containing protein n=1 Tax=Anopheles farauti TaxID=69004 RepID=A0A182QIW1_9DIPT